MAGGVSVVRKATLRLGAGRQADRQVKRSIWATSSLYQDTFGDNELMR
jgi:hypothetical protein